THRSARPEAEAIRQEESCAERTRWSRQWPRVTAESAAAVAGCISLGVKRAGERSAGNPPAPFDVAGAGDVAMGAGLRPTAKAVELPPDPTVRAPALDPTGPRLTAMSNGITDTCTPLKLGCPLKMIVVRLVAACLRASILAIPDPLRGRFMESVLSST